MPIIDPVMLREWYDSGPRQRESFEEFRSRIYASRADGFVQSYEESGKPIDAIQAVLFALEGGIPVPAPVSEWLSSGFSDYLAHHKARTPKRSLDRSLKMASPGRGRRRPENMQQAKSKRERVMAEMGCLVSIFGVTQGQAADMVAARLSDPATRRSDDPVHTRETLITYASESLIFKARMELDWSGLLNDLGWAKRTLERYPAYSIPPGLKSRFESLAET